MRRDHPRMCGKDATLNSFFQPVWGSPPHVRERHLRKAYVLSGTGDHPRMCGKDAINSVVVGFRVGSPPHVRERLHDFPLLPLPSGITPACAGKTESSSSSSRIKQDHPRMCGKDIIPTYPLRGVKGSPPHVRERRHRQDTHIVDDRITPACAGKTGLLASR